VADREVNRFLWDDVESRDDAGRIAEEIISLDLRRFQFGHWAIQDKNTGAFLGWTALGKLRSWSGPSDEIAVSYALRRASWGQGFATEAAGHLASRSRVWRGSWPWLTPEIRLRNEYWKR
jgi:RimJ/RimL family protein N-acetyltransferase